MDKWQIMRHEVSRQFARRLVQEAEIMENAQQLISRMCAAPLVIQYNEQGEELHTADRPFCRDMWCECHFDSELWQTYIYQPWLDGILTIEAGAALFSGR